MVLWHPAQLATPKAAPAEGCHRIVRLLPSRQVAAGIAAVRRSGGQVIIVVDVAGGTGHISMPFVSRNPVVL